MSNVIKQDQLTYCIGVNGKKKELGQGGNCIVYLARYQNKLVAVKHLKPELSRAELKAVGDEAYWEKLRLEIVSEMDMMETLSHPNVLPCLGGEKSTPYMVMEYLFKGDLFHLIKNKDPGVLWHANGAKMAVQIAQAVAHIHSKLFINRDVKSPNILVDHNYNIRLCDFGLATRIPRKDETVKPIREYSELWAAPEQIKADGLVGQPADVYALGTIIWELWTHSSPWQGFKGDLISHILSGATHPLPKDTPAELLSIFMGCWNLIPGQRLAASVVAILLQDFIDKPKPSYSNEFEPISPLILPKYSDALVVLAHKLSDKDLPPPWIYQLYKVLRANIVQSSVVHPDATLAAVLEAIVHSSAVLTRAGYLAKAHDMLRDAAAKIAPRVKSTSLLSAINLLLGRINKPIQHPVEARATLDQPPITFQFNETVLSDASASVRKFHTVLLLNDNPTDVEDATLELHQADALVSSLLTRSYLIRRFKQSNEPARDRMAVLNPAVTRLVRGGLVDHAWQLLVEASNDVQNFGAVHDEIVLRLAALAPHLNPQSAAILDPVRLPPQEWLDSTPFFKQAPSTWQDYRKRLQAIRDEFVQNLSNDNLQTHANDLLLHHTTFSRSLKALLATIISDCETMLGPAPCKYAFCAYGALATEDITLYGGIDMLLLLENDTAADWDPSKPATPASAYFQALSKLIQWQVHCIGETQTLGPDGKLSGFNFDNSWNNERFRGTTLSILKACKNAPNNKVETLLTYDLMSSTWVHGNDKCLLWAGFEREFADQLNNVYDTTKKPGPTNGFWQLSLFGAAVGFHNTDATQAGLLSNTTADYGNIRLKSLAKSIKQAVFDMAKFYFVNANSVEKCLHQLRRVIDPNFTQTASIFYAELQRIRVLIEAKVGYPVDSCQGIVTLNPTEVDTIKKGVLEILPAFMRKLTELTGGTPAAARRPTQ